MGRRDSVQQDSLFATTPSPIAQAISDPVHVGEDDQDAEPEQALVFRDSSPLANEITDQVLRGRSGDLLTSRHPVELSAIEPRTRRLNPLSRKAWYFMVSYALSREASTDQSAYLWRVPLGKLTTDIRFTSRNTRHLRDALEELQQTLVQWSNSARDSRTGEVRAWSSTQLLGSVEYVIDANGRHCIEWSFTPVLYRQLREHKHWFEHDLELLASIKRHSTMALLAEVSRYKTMPSGVTSRRPWRQWVPILTGESQEQSETSVLIANTKKRVPKPDKYTEYRYFNRDVVVKAVTELNQLQQEFVVSADPIKRGASVVELQFKIVRLRGFKPTKTTATPASASDLKPLLDLGFSERFASRLVAERTLQLCLSLAQQTAARIADSSLPAVETPTGFFMSLLKGQGDVSSPELLAHPPPKPSVSEVISEVLNDYRASLLTEFRAEWPSMPVEVRDDYVSRFASSFIPTATQAVRKEFERSAVARPIVSSLFFKWCAQDRAGHKWEPDSDELLAYTVTNRSH